MNSYSSGHSVGAFDNRHISTVTRHLNFPSNSPLSSDSKFPQTTAYLPLEIMGLDQFS